MLGVISAVALCEQIHPAQRLPRDTALSPSARSVEERMFKAIDPGQSLHAFGERLDVISELGQLAREHSMPGWDGISAPPVSQRTVQNVFQFIRALPKDIPNPALAVDPDDGAISLDWYGGRKRIFSVSIGQKRRLPCAFMDGNRRGYMIESFEGASISPAMLASIRQILA